MRVIKFRAWDSDRKKMRYPSVGQALISCIAGEGNSGVVDCLRTVPVGTTGLYKTELYDSYNGELMQFTGLEDKNGKEIYEGDVVRIANLSKNWKHGEPDFDWRIFEIIQNRYLWAFNNKVLYFPLADYDRKDGTVYDIEIIGNVYENKELLEGKK